MDYACDQCGLPCAANALPEDMRCVLPECLGWLEIPTRMIDRLSLALGLVSVVAGVLGVLGYLDYVAVPWVPAAVTSGACALGGMLASLGGHSNSAQYGRIASSIGFLVAYPPLVVFTFLLILLMLVLFVYGALETAEE